MATGAGRGHTPAAPAGGTGTPTETSRPPRGHRHSRRDTAILKWMRGHRDLTGGTGNSGGHLHPHGDTGAPGPRVAHGHPRRGQLVFRAPRPQFAVPRFPSLPGLKPPQSCSVAAAGAGVARFGSTRGTGRGIEWAASTVLPRGKAMEVPSLCEAHGSYPEGFLVQAVISVSANYPAPAGRAGSAQGGPPSERDLGTPRAARSGVGREGGRLGKLQPQTLPGVLQTQTRRVGVRTQRHGHTRACTHTCGCDIPECVHRRIHTITQTCAAQTQAQVHAHNRGTHEWTHVQVHTHHTYTLPCIPTCTQVPAQFSQPFMAVILLHVPWHSGN